MKLLYTHWLQIIWMIIGTILQIWIGSIKGLVVMVIGIIMFLLNTLCLISYKRKDEGRLSGIAHLTGNSIQ